MGDLYHTKAIIRSEAQNFLFRELSKLLELLEIHIVVGNHDYENLDCIAHSLTPLRWVDKNLHIYDKPTYVHDLNAIFMPYFHSANDFIKAISDCNKPNTMIFCHQGFRGFDYGNGILDDDGVPEEDLPRGAQVIAGHYHKRQKTDRVAYVGTPFSHSFGEANQDKYLAIWQNDQSLNDLNYIDTKNTLPRHIRLNFNASIGKFSEQLKYPLVAGDYVEVIIHCLKKDIVKYDRDFIEILLGTPTLATLRLRYEIEDDAQTVRLKDSSSPEESLKRYLTAKNQLELLDLGMRFLKDATI